ncbi:MAG: hypothetical protein N2445_09005, partial [Acidobacteria bacterium]|nr:hypothetical protein [Acidobacteriota bacterium]
MSDETEGKKEELPSFESLYAGRFQTDKNFKVTEISHESAALLNCPPEDIISKEFGSDFGPARSIIEDSLKGKIQLSDCKCLDGSSCNICLRVKEREDQKGYNIVFFKESPHF